MSPLFYFNFGSCLNYVAVNGSLAMLLIRMAVLSDFE